ncbi:MAG: hypothetical protein K0R03_1288 [Moraxellaceae bacterium]|jgi:hypothetical protein|nr:hypothetical protein [Moraxellaceae bacterium]
MKILDKIEQAVLFNAARLAILLLILALGIAVAGFAIESRSKPELISTKVTPDEIVSLYKPVPAGTTNPASPLAGLKIGPESLDYLSNDPKHESKTPIEARQQLRNLLRDFIVEHKIEGTARQELLDDIEASISAIRTGLKDGSLKQESLPDVPTLFAAIMQAKVAKIEQNKAAETAKETDRSLAKNMLFGAAAAIAFLTLMLVVLSIERQGRLRAV